MRYNIETTSTMSGKVVYLSYDDEDNKFNSLFNRRSVYQWMESYIEYNELMVNPVRYINVNGQQVWNPKTGFTEEWQCRALAHKLKYGK